MAVTLEKAVIVIEVEDSAVKASAKSLQALQTQIEGLEKSLRSLKSSSDSLTKINKDMSKGLDSVVKSAKAFSKELKGLGQGLNSVKLGGAADKTQKLANSQSALQRVLTKVNASLFDTASATDKVGNKSKKAESRVAKLASAYIRFSVASRSLQAARGFLSFIEEGERLNNLNSNLNKTIAGFGTLLAKAKEASAGLISDAQISKSVALMKSFGLATNNLDEVLGLVTKQAIVTGQDVNFLLDSFARGVSRASPLILDNLGIQIKLGEAKEEFAKKVGKSVLALTKEETVLAIQNKTMEELRKTTGEIDLSKVQVGAQRAGTALDNFLSTAARGFGDAVAYISSIGDPFERSQVNAAIFSRELPELNEKLRDYLSVLLAAEKATAESFKGAGQLVPPSLTASINTLQVQIDNLGKSRPLDGILSTKTLDVLDKLKGRVSSLAGDSKKDAESLISSISLLSGALGKDIDVKIFDSLKDTSDLSVEQIQKIKQELVNFEVGQFGEKIEEILSTYSTEFGEIGIPTDKVSEVAAIVREIQSGFSGAKDEANEFAKKLVEAERSANALTAQRRSQRRESLLFLDAISDSIALDSTLNAQQRSAQLFLIQAKRDLKLFEEEINAKKREGLRITSLETGQIFAQQAALAGQLGVAKALAKTYEKTAGFGGRASEIRVAADTKPFKDLDAQLDKLAQNFERLTSNQKFLSSQVAKDIRRVIEDTSELEALTKQIEEVQGRKVFRKSDAARKKIELETLALKKLSLQQKILNERTIEAEDRLESIVPSQLKYAKVTDSAKKTLEDQIKTLKKFKESLEAGGLEPSDTILGVLRESIVDLRQLEAGERALSKFVETWKDVLSQDDTQGKTLERFNLAMKQGLSPAEAYAKTMTKLQESLDSVSFSIKAGSGSITSQIKELRKLRDEYAENNRALTANQQAQLSSAETMDTVRTVIGSLATDMSLANTESKEVGRTAADLAKAFGGVSDIFGATAEAYDKSGGVFAAAADSGLAAAQKFVAGVAENEKQNAALQAAIEGVRAIAAGARYDFGAAALHGIAAVQWGIIAGTTKDKPKKAAGSGEPPSAAKDSLAAPNTPPSELVVNINSSALVTQAEIGHSINQAIRAAEREGFR